MAKPLRKGYTTGTYASAVAKAAAIFLLDKKVPNKVSVPLGKQSLRLYRPNRPKGKGGFPGGGYKRMRGTTRT